METTQPTSLGGIGATGALASLIDIGGAGDNSLIIVGAGEEGTGNSVDLAGELAFLNKAADLHLAACAAPTMLANYDVVIDGPIAVPKVAQFFDRVAGAILRSIAQDMGIEILSAKVDREALRLTMRLRCIPWQVDLLQHRYAEAKFTLVMELPAETVETTGEGDQGAA
jgi:hypothetical protein